MEEASIDYVLSRNYLSFDYSELENIYECINKKIFWVYKKGKMENKKEDTENKTIDLLEKYNSIEEIINSNQLKDEELKKLLESIYFPYIRNSGIYGGNNKDYFKRKENLKNLMKIVFDNNINVKRGDLKKFKEKNEKCSICCINDTTELGIDLKERKDSKYLFLFRGPQESGFRHNGNAPINICFECEFLNLITLLYISIKRPKILGYTSDLQEMIFINQKIMLKKNLYSEKAFYKKLIQENNKNLELYEFITDTNKGVILKFNSKVNYKEYLLTIEYLDIIDKFNFYKENAADLKHISDIMIKNKAYGNLKSLLLSQIILIKDEKGSRDIDEKSTFNNVELYIKCVELSSGKRKDEIMEYRKKKNIIYSKPAKILAAKMDNNKKKGFVFKILQLLKSDDREGIFQIIMTTLASYIIDIEDGFIEGILQSDELQFNINVGIFIQELMKSSGENGGK